MRRLMPAAVLLLVALLTILPAIADKAKTVYEQGQDAEARQNYEQAYGFYKQAYDLKPKDLRYRTSFERMRSKAADTIVHHGQNCCARRANWRNRWPLFQKAHRSIPPCSSRSRK